MRDGAKFCAPIQMINWKCRGKKMTSSEFSAGGEMGGFEPAGAPLALQPFFFSFRSPEMQLEQTPKVVKCAFL